MAFLVLAELESEEAWNPLVVVRGIARMRGVYFVQVTAAVVLFVGLTLGVYFLPIRGILFGGMLRKTLEHFVMIYTMVALVRAVALAYLRAGISLERA